MNTPLDNELPSPEAVARAFAAQLLKDIGLENLLEAVKRNAADSNKMTCHTHDFCDANDSMANALAAFGIHDGYGEIDTSPENDALNNLWIAAWGIAKYARFYTDKPAVQKIQTRSPHMMIL